MRKFGVGQSTCCATLKVANHYAQAGAPINGGVATKRVGAALLKTAWHPAICITLNTQPLITCLTFTVRSLLHSS